MASTYLSRTVGTASDSTRFVFSTWVKFSSQGNYPLVSGGNSSTNRAYVAISSDGSLNYIEIHGGTTYTWTTNAKLRDVNGWYHIYLQLDSNQATASDRVKIYINNELQTYSSSSTFPFTSGSRIFYNGTNWHRVGGSYDGSTSEYLNGLLAHTHFVDTTSSNGYDIYTPSTFGETDATTGIWKPKTAPSVTYGNQGYFLKFENSGSMGTDSSGNANNFTVNGTMTQTVDTPSNVFATLNPLILNSTGGANSLSNGNLTGYTQSTAYFGGFSSTIGVSSGKYYWEVKLVSTTAGSFYTAVGVTSENYINFVSSASRATTMAGAGIASQNETWEYKLWSGNKEHDGVQTAYGDTMTTGDIAMVALDLDNNYIYFGKNGTWQNSGDPTSGATGTGSAFALDTGYTYFPILDLYYNNTSAINFGNGYFGTTAVSSAQNPDDGIGIFEYAVPTGYKALCTKSINAQEYS
jgi:hypothetical protein